MKYLYWKEENLAAEDGQLPSEKIISDMYSRGFVFTRKGRGVMQQTRAVRIDLSKFELSSENRRILRKITNLGAIEQRVISLPLSSADYHWSIAKLAKDFYDKKFGPGIMSAAKIKELLTDATKSNFNTLLTFLKKEKNSGGVGVVTPALLGYAICYKNATLLHYSYPFYRLDNPNDLARHAVPKDMGLGMMILAIEHAREAGLRYVYLGSLQRPSDTYKLQFKGLEWFDGGPTGSNTWLTDIEKIKTILQ